MNLPLIAKDKANHAIYGFGISFAAAALAQLAGLPPPHARLLGTGVGCLAGGVKELLDLLANRRAIKQGLPPPREVTGRDAMATVLGALSYWTATEATGG